MTSPWVDLIDAPASPGDQLTADEILNQIYYNLDFLRDPPHGLYSLSTGASNITTTSTTFVDLTGFTQTITTQGGLVKVTFRVRANSTNARFDLLQDGVSVTADNDGLGAVAPASTFGNNCFVVFLAPTAGPHTFKIQWRVTTGTGTVYAAGLGQLHVEEIHVP